MLEVTIEKGLWVFTIRFLIVILRFIQGILSRIFWFLFISFPIKIFKNKDQKIKFKNFIDMEKLTHRIVYRYIKVMFSINRKISGIINESDAYERLINWNKKIPIFAYYTDKTTGTYYYAGRILEDGSRSADIIWLNKEKDIGTIQIVKSFFEEEHEDICFMIIYITGKYAGKSITIKKVESMKDLDEKSAEYYPNSLYLPPKWLIFLFEALVSIGIISTIVSVSKDSGYLLGKINSIFLSEYNKIVLLTHTIRNWFN